MNLYLKIKKNGFFVDVGANDGIIFSNTLFFEKNLDWTGICVEPLKSKYDQLMINRKSININCAIDEIEGSTKFFSNAGHTELLSGIVKYYDPRHHNRKEKEIKKHGESSNIIDIETLRLETIFDKYNVKKINYLSIDVEGAEFSVIKSINFDKVFIDIINFENNYADVSEPIIKYLEEKNYVVIKNSSDIFMINKKSEYTKNLS